MCCTTAPVDETFFDFWAYVQYNRYRLFWCCFVERNIRLTGLAVARTTEKYPTMYCIFSFYCSFFSIGLYSCPGHLLTPNTMVLWLWLKSFDHVKCNKHPRLNLCMCNLMHNTKCDPPCQSVPQVSKELKEIQESKLENIKKIRNTSPLLQYLEIYLINSYKQGIILNPDFVL